MAIFGVGSTKDGGIELKDEFFRDENFKIGWSYDEGKDLFEAASLLKAGDIIYIKSNAPGSRNIRVKGIGVVKTTFIHSLIDSDTGIQTLLDYHSFYIPVKWIITDEFHIEIPDDEGRLTASRASTFYEEYLPFVQNQIIDRLFS